MKDATTMINSVQKDAIRLLSWILDGIIPSEKYVVVNIAKSVNTNFTYPAIKEIPTTYGYTYEKVPDLLKLEKCVLGAVSDRWYVKVGKEIPNFDDRDSKQLHTLTAIGRSVGAINTDEYYATYIARNSYGTSSYYGPKDSTHYAVLIDVVASRHFIWKANNQMPSFTADKNLLHKGVSIPFEGQQALGIQKLIENINSIVSFQNFYCAIYQTDLKHYQDEIKQNDNKTTMTHSKLESVIKQIKSKIDASKIAGYLVIAQHNGFGLFVDQKMLNVPIS